jgi:hypothetical protein
MILVLSAPREYPCGDEKRIRVGMCILVGMCIRVGIKFWRLDPACVEAPYGMC